MIASDNVQLEPTEDLVWVSAGFYNLGSPFVFATRLEVTNRCRYLLAAGSTVAGFARRPRSTCKHGFWTVADCKGHARVGGSEIDPDDQRSVIERRAIRTGRHTGLALSVLCTIDFRDMIERGRGVDVVQMEGCTEMVLLRKGQSGFILIASRIQEAVSSWLPSISNIKGILETGRPVLASSVNSCQRRPLQYITE